MCWGGGGQQRRMCMVEPARNLQWPSGCFDLALTHSPTQKKVPKNVFIMYGVISHSTATIKIIPPVPEGAEGATASHPAVGCFSRKLKDKLTLKSN